MTAPTISLTWDFICRLTTCAEALDWGRQTYDGRVNIPASTLIRRLMRENKLDWANWLIVRVMTPPQYLRYAIYAAEQVLNLYERQYHGDVRPRQAIEAARRCLHDDSQSAGAAWAAGAAGAAGAAWAAWAAAMAAGAAWAAEAAAMAAEAAMKRKILTYGLRVLSEKESR